MRCNSSPGKISHLHLSFSNSKSQSKNDINKQKEINIQSIKQIGNYILGSELGSGAFGKVVLATHILTNEKVAIKILDKIILSETPEDLELVYQEISILKIVKHKNIAQLYEILETPKHIFIIIEYCEGKDLMDYILTKSKLTEIESLKLFQQLINTLLYLHSQNITHRDIKIDNMLLDKNKNLKLVDFGLSTYYSDDKLLNQPCGTVVYAAPEVLEGKEYHGMLADVWSSGIVLYGMLSGFLPFCDNDDEINKKNVLKGKIEIPNFFPPLVIDLLSHMLQENPIKRFTLQDIRDHPWFNLRKFNMIPGIVIGYNKIPVDDDVLNECLKFGFNKDKVKESIVNNKFNNSTAVYYLLVKKKVNLGKCSVSDLCSKEFIDFVLNEKNVVFYNEKNNCNYDVEDKNDDNFNNRDENVYSEENKICNNENKVINKENNVGNSRNNNNNVKDDKFEIEILSFEKENIQINGNNINKNEGKKDEKILNQNLLKTTKESSNNSINNNSINKNTNHIKTEKIPHKKFINKKAFINKSIEKDKKSKLNKGICKEEKQNVKNIQNLSMNETIEEQLYKKKKKDVITKLKKTQGVIIQTKIKNLLSQKIDEIKYQTSRSKKNKNYNLSKSIDSSKKLYDEENELNEKNIAISKRKNNNNYMNTSIDNNTPKKIGIKKNSVLNSSIKNSQSHNNKKNNNKEKSDTTRNQIKKVLSRTISNNSNINYNNDTHNINSNSKNILTSYRNHKNDKTTFSKLNLSVQFDKIAKNIKIKRNVLKFEKNKNKKYNKYISFSSISTINQNSNSKRKNISKEKSNLSRSISEKSNLKMRIKYEEKIRRNNKILNRSVCGLINKKYEVILNKSLREDIRNKSLDKKINLKKELLIPKDKQIRKIMHLNYFTDRNNKSNQKYNIESSVICYRKKSPFEIRDLSDSPKHNNLLNEKTRKRKIPWKIKKDGIDKNLEYDIIYHKYIKKLAKPKKNKINQSKIPLNQSNITIKPIYHNNDLNISINKITNTNFEKYNISVRNNNNKNERKKSIRIRNKNFIKGKNHISLSSNISVNSSNSTYDIGMIYLTIYNGPIDISCIYSKDNSFINCIKFITEKLKKNNIYFNMTKQNKFSCLKNGKHFEIEIYKLCSCVQGINPFYYKFKSKQFPNDYKLFSNIFLNN